MNARDQLSAWLADVGVEDLGIDFYGLTRLNLLSVQRTAPGEHGAQEHAGVRQWNASGRHERTPSVDVEAGPLPGVSELGVDQVRHTDQGHRCW